MCLCVLALPAPLEFSSYEQVFYDRIHLTWQAPSVTTDFFGYKIDYFPEAQPKPAIHITFHLNVTNVIIHNLRKSHFVVVRMLCCICYIILECSVSSLLLDFHFVV